jgi:hypothetical protein
MWPIAPTWPGSAATLATLDNVGAVGFFISIVIGTDDLGLMQLLRR